MKKSTGHAKRKMAIKKNRHTQPEPEQLEPEKTSTNKSKDYIQGVIKKSKGRPKKIKDIGE